MYKKLLLTLSIFISTFVLVSSFSHTYAIECSSLMDVGTPPGIEQIVCPVFRGINFARYAAGIAFIFMLGAGAIKLAVSQGDPKGFEAASRTWFYAIIGIAIIFFVTSVFSIVGRSFGIENALDPQSLETSISSSIEETKELLGVGSRATFLDAFAGWFGGSRTPPRSTNPCDSFIGDDDLHAVCTGVSGHMYLACYNSEVVMEDDPSLVDVYSTVCTNAFDDAQTLCAYPDSDVSQNHPELCDYLSDLGNDPGETPIVSTTELLGYGCGDLTDHFNPIDLPRDDWSTALGEACPNWISDPAGMAGACFYGNLSGIDMYAPENAVACGELLDAACYECGDAAAQTQYWAQNTPPYGTFCCHGCGVCN